MGWVTHQDGQKNYDMDYTIIDHYNFNTTDLNN